MAVQIFELIFILVLILANGYFALSELAVLSAKKLKLREMAEKSRQGRAALELGENSSQFLSTVQIGITLVGVASGAIGGATIASNLAKFFARVPFLAGFADSLSVFIVIVMISYLSLVLGELVPKQIALSNPERYAMMVAPVMQRMSKWLAPVSKILSSSTNFVTHLLGIDQDDSPEISVEELRLMIDEGRNLGILAPSEEVMLEQVLRFDDARIESLVTPRREIVRIDVHASQNKIRKKLLSTRFEKIPIVDGDLDNILGVVYSQDLLSQYLKTGVFDLKTILTPAVFIPDGWDLLEALDLMRRNRTDVVFVLNEFGGVDGMVTSKDILEAIVGDMPELDESFDPKIVKREDGSYLLDGMLSVEIFQELLNVEFETDERSRVQTLAGVVIHHLGAIPNTGDRFELFGYQFEIIDMDHHRIDKLLVEKL